MHVKPSLTERPIKPPLGIKPKYIRDLERLEEIKAGIERCTTISYEIPLSWVQEYNEICQSLRKPRGKE